MKSTHQTLLALSVSCVLAASLAGCGVQITGVALDLPDSLEKGAVITAEPEYIFDGATPESAALAKKLDALGIGYVSSDPTVVMVDDFGNLAALKAGTAEVALSSQDGTLTASKTIEVVVTPTDITTTDTLTLQPEETAQLTYTVAPEEALADNVTYTSSDETVATVDAEGNVTAIADGTATITVDVNGVTAECEVTVATKVASTVGNSNSGSSTTSSGQAQNFSAAASSSFEYGAIPFSLASNGNWWGIDQSDSAYWAVLNNINAMRAAGGLSALSPSSSLDAIADSRCDYQLVNDTLSHDGAQSPEILAQSQKSASEVCSAWQNSPSHYAVIMNPNFTQIGICCYFEIGGKTIWCCTFG